MGGGGERKWDRPEGIPPEMLTLLFTPAVEGDSDEEGGGDRADEVDADADADTDASPMSPSRVYPGSESGL
jgi:hypothetical protein